MEYLHIQISSKNGGIIKEIEPIPFILTNKIGGYSFLSPSPFSTYCGMFFRKDDKLYKFIEDITIPGNITNLSYHHWYVEWERGGIKEEFFMPKEHNCLVYEQSKKEPFNLFLDAKEAYDNKIWGRNYEISNHGDIILIKFSKVTDMKEDDSHGNIEYELFLAIKGEDINYDNISQWLARYYSFDQKRNKNTPARYVFNSIKISSKKVVFSISNKKKEAISEADFVYKNLQMLKDKDKGYNSSLIKNDQRLNHEIEGAYNCAKSSLDSLIVDSKDTFGLYAGLPWFFQYWGRDTAISLKGVMLTGEYKTANRLLSSLLDSINPDGKLATRYPHSPLGSADGAGWLFFRIREFLKLCNEKEHLIRYFQSGDLEKIKDKLHFSVHEIIENYSEHYLIWNQAKETWMDTEYKGDSRDGFRIEIQALMLSMIDFLLEFSEEKIHFDLKEKMLAKVRTEFLKEGILTDGKGDLTVRPNLFIAAYIYPELLSQEEWINTFDYVLPKLWMNWGGLSTISKEDKLFIPTDTGEDNKSYHHGDSWFWINNLAAIVLTRLDKDKYKDYIDKILKASTDEILYQGVAGHHAEISNAENMESTGCLAQAWSAAMYIELVNELFLKDNKIE